MPEHTDRRGISLHCRTRFGSFAADSLAALRRLVGPTNFNAEVTRSQRKSHGRKARTAMLFPRAARVTFCILSLLIAIGCGGPKSNREKVSGKVTFKGGP